MDHQHVFDPEVRLAHDVQAVRHQEVIVLMDASRERVLDRDDTVADGGGFYGKEDVSK